jgi:hypothetical protein
MLIHRFVTAPLLALAVLAAGCGGGGLKTYPVRGKVVLADGDVSILADSYVEAALESNTNVRASGRLRPDGTFELQTLRDGAVRNGAEAGTYVVRISLEEEGSRDVQKRRQAAVHPRFLDPKQSGLKIEVPPPGEVVLTVSAK